MAFGVVRMGNFGRMVGRGLGGISGYGTCEVCKLALLVTLRIVRGPFSYAVSIDRFLRTFVFVFRFPYTCSVCPFVHLSVYFSGIPLLFCGGDL